MPGQPDVEHDRVVAARAPRGRDRPRPTRRPRRRSPRRAARRSARCARRPRHRRSESFTHSLTAQPACPTSERACPLPDRSAATLNTAARSRTAIPWDYCRRPRSTRRVPRRCGGRSPGRGRSPSLGRVIRHEELLAVGRRHARAVVGDDEPRDRVRRVVLRLDGNARLAAGRGPPASAHGLDRIVHEVDDDAADLLDVEPDGRQRRREASARCGCG